MAGRISIPELQALLEYDPASGSLTWQPRARSQFSSERGYKKFVTAHQGQQTFMADNGEGYLCGVIRRRTYRAHIVAWALYYGEWPVSAVDHRNGNRKDNSISNLRLADEAQNACNAKLRSDNTSGVKGVSFRRSTGMWIARIYFRRRCYMLGNFSDLGSAAAAYADAARQIHGEFARTA
jgi:hypothetical protein